MKKLTAKKHRRNLFYFILIVGGCFGVVLITDYQKPLKRLGEVIFPDNLSGTASDALSQNTSRGVVDQQQDAEVRQPLKETIPDFSVFTNSKMKKEAFFDFLRPSVRNVNSQILEDRQFVEATLGVLEQKRDLKSDPEKYNILLDKSDVTLGNQLLLKTDAEKLVALAKKYKIKKFDVYQPEKLRALLYRLDVIPESMVFAQAANESAWGTSRFAREGNNIFGQWCYTKGCGIVPARRPEGAEYEVALYRSVHESVQNYFRNINTNTAYRKVREIRSIARAEQRHVCGFRLVEGLESYSSRGWDYILDLQSLIRSNKLHQH